MSTIDPLSAYGSSALPNRFSEMGSEEFVKVIFTELAHQDPLQPNDTGALLEQLSTLRSIQSDLDLTENLRTVVTQNELASAGTLIGRYVTGVSEALERVTGRVRSVTKTPEGPVLNFSDGTRMAFSAVERMHGSDPGVAP